MYLPTKKIGKNNPKAEEIKADNAARQEWNWTADMALLTGISEAEILEVKQTEIHEKVRQSIHQREMSPKPTLDIDMAEFRAMWNLMIKGRSQGYQALAGQGTAAGRPALRIYIYSRLTEKYAFAPQKIEKVKIIFVNFSKSICIFENTVVQCKGQTKLNVERGSTFS